MKKFKFCLLIILSTILSCNKTSDDKKIVLKVGKLEVTKHEFERNKGRELILSPDAINSKVNQEKVIAWKNSYIDKCYIISDAYSKSYDTIKSYQNTADRVGNEMMTSKHGYLWQKTIVPVIDTYKIATKEKLEKRKKIFNFNYIQSPSKEDLTELFKNNTEPKTKKDFEEISKKIKNSKNITSGYISKQWPFYGLGNEKDYLYNLKEGEVTKVINTGKYYTILCLDYVETVNLGDKDKEQLQNDLGMVMEQEMIDKKSIEIKNYCKPEFNYANINTLYEFVKKGNHILHFNKDLEFVRYTYNNKHVIVNTKAFAQYCKNIVFVPDIKSLDQLTEIVGSVYENEYLLDEAKKLNLFNSDDYILDRKNFFNNMLYNGYISREVTKNIKTDSLEIVNYYKNNLKLFSQPKNIIANLYFFRNQNEAYFNCALISNLLRRNEFSKTKDNTIVKGLEKYVPSITFNLESKECSNELRNALLTVKTGMVSKSPVLYKGEYVIIHKENEVGNCTKRLSDVYSFIGNKLKNEKTNRELKKVIDNLKKKYKVEIDKTGI